MGNNITHTIQEQYSCNTIYPRNMVCFRYVFVNTSIEVINNNNKNNNTITIIIVKCKPSQTF